VQQAVNDKQLMDDLHTVTVAAISIDVKARITDATISTVSIYTLSITTAAS